MLDLNKLEMQLDKALLEDDLEEWILNKRKNNITDIEKLKYEAYSKALHIAYVRELEEVTEELKKKYGID